MSDDEETMVRRRLRRLVAEGSDEPSGPRSLSASRPAGGRDAWASGTEAADTSHVGPVPPAAWHAVEVDADATEAAAGRAEATTPPASRLPGPGAFDPGRRGVRALAVVSVVVVFGAGLWAWRSRPEAEPVRPSAPAVPEASVLAGASVAPEAAASLTGELVVAVAGKVRRPGLVRVPAGARVADAVQAAGGALPGVDVALLNPARKVSDGELILVGVAAPPGVTMPAAPGAPPAAGAAPGPGERLNLNTATLAQLDALPGVGPVLAQRILTHRDQHGGFRSVGDLRRVDGIGDARYEQLKDLVTV
ncbi:ComEA family DNA-binding protein [Micromonospora sp. KC606]|uniref:ComEA family DNA-binding protein n=1 Tax=Micromonospora sp. KC606 TaxID=2530379 RepID=UPI00104CA2DD|nr:ComEA family DNA-binding protein [Micromonospora sp. KC606]TDC83145.1 ComEA family DNA-binding protein [Micromonospora sp. KC606]